MSRTGFEHAQAPADIATGYWRLPPGGQTALRLLLPPGIVGQRTGGLVAFRPFYVNGPPYGGLVGDVHDAARFLSLHLGDGAAGGQRLLSAESAVAMRTLTTNGSKLTTGLGWWRRHEADDGSGLVEHLGGGGAYRNLMRLYPDTPAGGRHVRKPHQLPRGAPDRSSSHVRNRAAVVPGSDAAADVTIPALLAVLAFTSSLSWRPARRRIPAESACEPLTARRGVAALIALFCGAAQDCARSANRVPEPPQARRRFIHDDIYLDHLLVRPRPGHPHATAGTPECSGVFHGLGPS